MDRVAATKPNPECKRSLCSGFSAPMPMMCSIPRRAGQDTLPGLGVVPGGEAVPKAESCRKSSGPRLGESCALWMATVATLDGQALSAGGRDDPLPRAQGGRGKWGTLTPGSHSPLSGHLRPGQSSGKQ